ncbi:hypothetical protein R3P38DRAFT_2810471 [Favolaschia claudopus]|uniref:Uncharacterized protein n=1 Tax=Favolaschia claudopus TaxID=2862362 RepID=A0AAV9ZC67_9AGAR
MPAHYLLPGYTRGLGGTPHPLDSETHIAARHQSGKFYDRTQLGGTWQGPDRAPTWVPAVGVSLNHPPAPYVSERNRAPHAAPSRDSRFNTRQWQDDYGPPLSNDNRFYPRAGPSRVPPRYYSPERPTQNDFAGYHAQRGPSPPRHYGSSRHSGTASGSTSDNSSRYQYDSRSASPHYALPITKVKTGWTRKVFPPPIAQATIDPRGHPVCPLETIQGDEQDFGSESDKRTLPSNWKALEVQRRAEELAENPDAYALKRPLVLAEAGVWAGLVMADVDQAKNLLRWVRRTEESAYAYLTFTCAILLNLPVLPRTSGEAYLIARCGAAKAAYWVRKTNSHKIPMTTSAFSAYDDVEMDDIPIQLGNAAAGESNVTVFTGERLEGRGSIE